MRGNLTKYSKEYAEEMAKEQVWRNMSDVKTNITSAIETFRTTKTIADSWGIEIDDIRDIFFELMNVDLEEDPYM